MKMKLTSEKRKTITFLLLIILAFVVGAAIATKLTNNYYSKLFDEIELSNPAFNIYETVKVLRYLRNNELKKAIDYEEWRLDDNLMHLSNYLKDTSLNNHRVINYANYCINIAYKYRLKYPSDIKKCSVTRNTISYLFKDKPESVN